MHRRVPLSDVTVIIAGAALPAAAAEWPVRAIEEAAAVSLLDDKADRPYCICGTAAAVERCLLTWTKMKARLLYVVTDDERALLGTARNLTVSTLADGEWEEAIARVCSMHVETIAEMIVGHALRAPDAVALSDASGEMTYLELCERALALATTLTRDSDVASGEPPAVPGGLQAGDVVGVVLPAAAPSIVCLLGLSFGGLVPCHLSKLEALRGVQLERMARCPQHGACRAVLSVEALALPVGTEACLVEQLLVEGHGRAWKPEARRLELLGELLERLL